MTQIRKDRLPAQSALWSHYAPGDFMDCYAVKSALAPREAALRGLALPRWASALLSLRNRIVSPLGLKTEADAGLPAVGLFPIRKDTAEEFVLGLDDRHLDFRITVCRSGPDLFLSTWVHPHNAFGRLYLALVMPFHVLITRGAIARMAG